MCYFVVTINLFLAINIFFWFKNFFIKSFFFFFFFWWLVKVYDFLSSMKILFTLQRVVTEFKSLCHLKYIPNYMYFCNGFIDVYGGKHYLRAYPFIFLFLMNLALKIFFLKYMLYNCDIYISVWL
jgi:hypothetical protein